VDGPAPSRPDPSRWSAALLFDARQRHRSIPPIGLIYIYFQPGSDTEDHIHSRPVSVASADGSTVDISKCPARGDRIAIDVPDDVTDGVYIQPVVTAAARSGPPALLDLQVRRGDRLPP
jgi:hypothetical protein